MKPTVIPAPILLLVFATASTGAAAPENKPRREVFAEFTAVVDLGKDHGQSFGSIFEARDAQGRVFAGAGFMDVYNTRFRSDRHTLQFFVRPKADRNAFTLDRLPHPDLDCGVYLFDLDDTVYAWSSVRNNSIRRWDEAAGRWLDAPPPGAKHLRSGDGVMRLGKGRLVFADNQASYDGRVILEPPLIGRYYNFYFAEGRLFFYHTHRRRGGATMIHACRWTPEDPSPIDFSESVVMKAKYVGATPFAWGQFAGKVLTVSNFGGVYAFDGSAWKTLLEADDQVSYQVYSMLNYHDRLLLAQYPTGQLFEYRGEGLKLLEGWPPRLPGVSPSAREAQTLGIYRGDLFVGVWPWAELWRHDHDTDRWHSMGRMFSHPPLTDKTVHPYEAAAKRFGLVTNHWGQRVTGMAPLGPSLMLSTSSKGTSAWSDEYDFLDDAQRREYGAVLRLTMPGALATRIEWKNGPTTLQFIIESDRLVIRQDGKPLGSAPLPPSILDGLRPSKIDWGKGVFGRFEGNLLRRESSVR